MNSDNADSKRRLNLSGALRGLRRRADMSQRELASRSGLTQPQLARLESGEHNNPSLRTLERLVAAAGARLAIVDIDGTEPQPPANDQRRDGASRRFPAHLDIADATRWVKQQPRAGFTFLRVRRTRDELRRDRAGVRRWMLFVEFRLLGPGDSAVLRTLHETAHLLDLTGRVLPPRQQDPDEHQQPGEQSVVHAGVLPGAQTGAEVALRYLRNPALRHWVAERSGHILGHLVAYLQRRHDGPPALVITDVGLLPEHRADLVGPHLAAAVCDEAVRLGVGDIWAIADHPAVAQQLRHLGFRAASKKCRLLMV